MYELLITSIINWKLLNDITERYNKTILTVI